MGATNCGEVAAGSGVGFRIFHISLTVAGWKNWGSTIDRGQHSVSARGTGPLGCPQGTNRTHRKLSAHASEPSLEARQALVRLGQLHHELGCRAAKHTSAGLGSVRLYY